MTLEFVKMTGAGNDFIVMDNRSKSIQLSPEQVAQLCDRHFGIGADGLILLEPNTKGQADWSWRFYNADGSDADMCGNGARCFAQFIRQTTGWDREGLRFETAAGIIDAAFVGDLVSIGLTPPKDLQLDQKLETGQGVLEVHSIHTGVPHAVVFVPDADTAHVSKLGHELRWHSHFQPKGTNVNFVQILGPGRIRVRTYERGVEGETLACGTGVTASALIFAVKQGVSSPIQVDVQGGDTLNVAFETSPVNGWEHVRLTGPARRVFQGTIDCPPR